MSASYTPVFISLYILLTFVFALSKLEAVLSIADDCPMLSKGVTMLPR